MSREIRGTQGRSGPTDVAGEHILGGSDPISGSAGLCGLGFCPFLVHDCHIAGPRVASREVTIRLSAIWRGRIVIGWGWIFTAIEHWNAECVGWHVCKRGDRFAALQPISMGLARLYASTSAGAARGLALRMDHGSQYLSDHFTNQIKFWGIQPSYAFVEQPQTNGVAERSIAKEQIIGRIYRNIAELRNAVRGFVDSTMPSAWRRTAT